MNEISEKATIGPEDVSSKPLQDYKAQSSPAVSDNDQRPSIRTPQELMEWLDGEIERHRSQEACYTRGTYHKGYWEGHVSKGERLKTRLQWVIDCMEGRA